MCGEGTGVDAVFGKVGAVLVLVGVLLDYIVGLLRSRKWLGGCSMLSYLLSAHEQKMLYGVRNTRHTFNIAELAHIDVHTSNGLIGNTLVYD